MRGVEQEGEVPDERTVLKTTLNIAWPSILESFLISLVGMVDTVMVSSLGSYAIAAVGLTTQPKFIALAVFMSLNVAISAIVARRRGEGDRDKMCIRDRCRAAPSPARHRCAGTAPPCRGAGGSSPGRCPACLLYTSRCV